MDVVYELQGTVEKENRTMDDFEIQVVEGAGHAFAHHPKTELDKIDSEISLSQGVEYLCVNLWGEGEPGKYNTWFFFIL